MKKNQFVNVSMALLFCTAIISSNATAEEMSALPSGLHFTLKDGVKINVPATEDKIQAVEFDTITDSSIQGVRTKCELEFKGSETPYVFTKDENETMHSMGQMSSSEWIYYASISNKANDSKLKYFWCYLIDSNNNQIKITNPENTFNFENFKKIISQYFDIKEM